MSGMNVIFHALAAVALVALLIAWAKARAERDFLRSLGCELAWRGRHKRLLVEEPGRFLRRFARAWGIELDETTSLPTAPQRLEPLPLFELFLHRGLTLIRCRETGVELYVERSTGALESEAEQLSLALGGLMIKIMPHAAAGSITGGNKT